MGESESHAMPILWVPLRPPGNDERPNGELVEVGLGYLLPGVQNKAKTTPQYGPKPMVRMVPLASLLKKVTLLVALWRELGVYACRSGHSFVCCFDLHPLGMRKGGCYATRSRASPEHSLTADLPSWSRAQPVACRRNPPGGHLRLGGSAEGYILDQLKALQAQEMRLPKPQKHKKASLSEVV